MKMKYAACGAGVMALLIALPVHAQERATLVLVDGQRPSGELIDLNAGGFTLVANGETRQYPAADVAAVEFVAVAPAPGTQARIDAGQSLVVLRTGEVVEGRLVDIGGTHPLRLSIDTASGPRDYQSNDVAQIYLYAPKLLVAEAPVRVVPPPPGAATVRGDRPWTSTGIMVARGDRVEFHGTGEIMIGATSPSSVDGNPAATSDASRYPVRRASAGALIGRVAGGEPFAIGANTQPIVMPANGLLLLGVNDDHFEDNSGTFTVILTRFVK